MKTTATRNTKLGGTEGHRDCGCNRENDESDALTRSLSVIVDCILVAYFAWCAWLIVRMLMM